MLFPFDDEKPRIRKADQEWMKIKDGKTGAAKVAVRLNICGKLVYSVELFSLLHSTGKVERYGLAP